MDKVKSRYLQDRIMTASPAQRVVMLFDRLAVDLMRAQQAEDESSAAGHLGHATDIVAELAGSLDHSVGGPADNLAALYGFLLRELTALRFRDERDRIESLTPIVSGLRDAFATAAATTAAPAANCARVG